MNHAVEVGVLFKISKGKKCQEVKNSAIRYLQIDDLRNNNNIKYATSDPSYVSCSKKDVIIAWDGANAGTIGYGLEGVIGSTLAKLVPQSDAVYPSYAGRFLQSKFRYLRDNCTGATIPHISRPSLQGLKLPLPPLEEQKKIAAILDAADVLRQKDAQLIAKYNALSQSLFLELFGDYFKQKKCYKSIKDVANFIDYRGKTPSRTSDGVPLITAKSVRQGYFDKSRLDFITTEVYQNIMTRGFPKVGDVLFTTEGATMGYTCRVPEGLGNFAVGQRLITLQPNHQFNSISLDFVINSREIQGEVFRLATGSAVKGIRSAKFAKILIPTPPITVQNQFAEHIQAIEAQKQQAQAALQKSEDLFNSLLQRAFKGELTA